jgi:hypothetical protein
MCVWGAFLFNNTICRIEELKITIFISDGNARNKVLINNGKVMKLTTKKAQTIGYVVL